MSTRDESTRDWTHEGLDIRIILKVVNPYIPELICISEGVKTTKKTGPVIINGSMRVERVGRDVILQRDNFIIQYFETGVSAGISRIRIKLLVNPPVCVYEQSKGGFNIELATVNRVGLKVLLQELAQLANTLQETGESIKILAKKKKESIRL